MSRKAFEWLWIVLAVLMALSAVIHLLGRDWWAAFVALSAANVGLYVASLLREIRTLREAATRDRLIPGVFR